MAYEYPKYKRREVNKYVRKYSDIENCISYDVMKYMMGNDTYRNLIILSKDVSKLVDATENKVIKKLLQNLTLTVEMQEKINKLRKHRELEEIQFEDYIGTKM